MKKGTFILLIFNLAHLLFAGNKPDAKWDRFFPEILQKSPYLKNEVVKINHYAQLDPNLIYIYFEYLHRKFNLKTNNPDSNFSAYFGALLNQRKAEKNKWVQKILAQIDKKSFTPFVKAKLKRIFRSIAPEYNLAQLKEKVIPPRELDVNRQAYFNYIYLSGHFGETYKEQVNYVDMYGRELIKMAAFFDEKYTHWQSISKHQRKKLVSKALQHSYLFRDSYLNWLSRTDFSLMDFIYRIMNPVFENHNQVIVGYSFNFPQVTHENVIDFKDLLGQEFKRSLKVEYYHFFNIGFRYALRKRQESFSFITALLGVGLSAKAETKKSEYLGYFLKSNEDFFVKGKYYIENMQPDQLRAFFAELSVPFLFLSDLFYFEAGFHAAYYQITLKYDFTFDGSAYDRVHSTYPDFYHGWSKRAKNSQFKFYPLLSFNYCIFDLITFRLSTLINNRVQGTLFYSF